jgi:hypothetical protein
MGPAMAYFNGASKLTEHEFPMANSFLALETEKTAGTALSARSLPELTKATSLLLPS